MEFENVNNLNIALEAASKKKSTHIIRSIAHAIKKMIRRAKPKCCSIPSSPLTSEEIDNAANEALESKMILRSFDAFVERDLRHFNYVTDFQTATQQS